jgi:hypothetical protein
VYPRSIPVLAVLVVGVGAPNLGQAQPPPTPPFGQEVVKLLLAGKSDEAVRSCVRRLDADKGDVEAREALEMALRYCRMVNATEVLDRWFREWATNAPANATALTWLGAALALDPGRRLEAEASYQRALALDADLPDVHFRLAALRELQGKADEAQAEWRRFLELEPDSDRAWLVRHRLAVIDCSLLCPNDPAAARHSSWSPDGKQIAYLREENQALAVCRVSTGEQRLLPKPPVAQRLTATAWSPDGRWIAASGATANYQTKRVFIVDPLGQQEPRLPFGQLSAYQCDWSPDARQVLSFVTAKGLYTADADGGAVAPVAGYARFDRQHHLASFTPDGERVCTSGGQGDRREIFIWDFPEARHCVQLTRNGAHNQAPRMRPDGDIVLFAANSETGLRHLRAVAVNEPGRDVLVLECLYASEWGPFSAWAPDGRQFSVSRPWLGPEWIVTLGGLDTRPVKLTAGQQEGGLLVSVTNVSEAARAVNVRYELFDPNSFRVAEGPVGQPDMTLKPGGIIEFPLPLTEAKKPGTYTAKLTAMTEKGERVVELVDYERK